MLVGAKWCKKGSVVKVSKDRADREIRRKNAESTDATPTVNTDPPQAATPDEQEPAQTPATGSPGELEGWPGADDLQAAGIETVDALRALIDEHGDAWPKQVDGVGPATAAKIVEELDALDG